MAQLVREAMTSEPICLTNNTTITDAATQMRDYDIGDVLVTENGRIRGVLTDRDIVVRALAEGRDPGATTIGEIASRHLITICPEGQVSRAIVLMHQHGNIRLPFFQIYW